MHCGKSFEGKNIKFCSQPCKDSHISTLERKVREAVASDTGHTDNFSRE